MRKEKAQIMDDHAMARAVTRISHEILEKNDGADSLVILGMLSRGEQLSKRIAGKIREIESREIPVGFLDITPHRDDRRDEEPGDQSQIPFDLTDQIVVLVDDVLYTGRSVRAAIDAVMSRGRPKKVQLAVLIDRGHRELPIRPDFVGKNLPTSRGEMVQVMVRERDGIDRVVIYDVEDSGSGE